MPRTDGKGSRVCVKALRDLLAESFTPPASRPRQKSNAAGHVTTLSRRRLTWPVRNGSRPCYLSGMAAHSSPNRGFATHTISHTFGIGIVVYRDGYTTQQHAINEGTNYLGHQADRPRKSLLPFGMDGVFMNTGCRMGVHLRVPLIKRLAMLYCSTLPRVHSYQCRYSYAP